MPGISVLRTPGWNPLYDHQGWLEPSGMRREAHIAVVVSTSHGQMAVSANALAGTRDIIVRPLPSSVGGSKLVLGAVLSLDSNREAFADNPQANAFLTREYRHPFVVPTESEV